MARLVVLLQIAFRNLLASKMNLIIGFIMLAGTTLVVIGTALFDSLDRAMASSITSSVAGHLQVYSSKSKDELAIFGGGMGGQDPDLAPIDDFPKVRAALEALPNVKQVVPMGFATALVTSGNTADLTLAELRERVKARAGGKATPEQLAELESLKLHVRELARLLRRDLENLRQMSDADDGAAMAVADEVAGEAFWADFDARADEKLEFLENKLAQLMADGDMVGMRYAGTDLDAYASAFDRFEIVDGQRVPSGERGMLIGKFFYEEAFKLKPARRLDQLKESIDVNRKRIADDPDLQRRIKELSQQTNTIVYQLDPLKQRELVKRLQASLKSTETDPDKLLQLLMQVDDANFSERYRIFYADVAPLVELYRVRIGDEISLQTLGAGYAQSANVKVWGTFQFKGLEKAPIASATNLVDLVTFGDLYGYMSPERVAEIRAIQQQTGAGEIRREDAEAALFGEDAQLVTEAAQQTIDEAQVLGKVDRRARATTYTAEELSNALTLDAAVMLKDPSDLEASAAAIRAVAEREGFALRVIDWQEAAGLLGDMTLVARLLLIVISLVIFVVAVVIINNAMMMATLQRVREIGTLRAIGSQKGFVLTMVLIETTVLGVVFGILGAGLGAGLIRWWGQVGIPAGNEQLYLFFGGPRLFPTMGFVHVAIAFAVVIAVCAISALYPAYLATRVAPVTAMQSAEE